MNTFEGLSANSWYGRPVEAKKPTVSGALTVGGCLPNRVPVVCLFACFDALTGDALGWVTCTPWTASPSGRGELRRPSPIRRLFGLAAYFAAFLLPTPMLSNVSVTS